MDADEESKENSQDDEHNLSEKPEEEERDRHSDNQPPTCSQDNTGAGESSKCEDKKCSIANNDKDTS